MLFATPPTFFLSSISISTLSTPVISFTWRQLRHFISIFCMRSIPLFLTGLRVIVQLARRVASVSIARILRCSSSYFRYFLDFSEQSESFLSYC